MYSFTFTRQHPTTPRQGEMSIGERAPNSLPAWLQVQGETLSQRNKVESDRAGPSVLFWPPQVQAWAHTPPHTCRYTHTHIHRSNKAAKGREPSPPCFQQKYLPLNLMIQVQSLESMLRLKSGTQITTTRPTSMQKQSLLLVNSGPSVHPKWQQ